MQEIGLASCATFMCGSSQIDWTDLLIAYNLYDQKYQPKMRAVHSGYPDMEAVVGDMVFLYDWRSASVNKTFLDILDLTATRATTDPRDRVFALLSHPSARLESSVDASVELVTEPDYTKNVPDVYVDVARNHIIATLVVHPLQSKSWYPVVGP
jgi:hypothetical protein